MEEELVYLKETIIIEIKEVAGIKIQHETKKSA